MHDKEKKINKLFIYWLCTSLLLVYFAVLIGGLTRLTNSGLSITEWELFKGILPPLTNTSWNLYFEAYKKIPQYELLNFNMSLSEFKIIFYWEYFHRIIARIIGLFFLIPLIFFYFSKKIKKKYLNTCLVILLLIVFQGVIGWYMVKSGLVKDTTVSHYRLSLHLSTAILIMSIMFWLIRNVISNNEKFFLDKLEDIIEDRISNPQSNSYISNLFNNGIDKIAQKLGEEATELVIASKNSDKKEFIYESADLLFHFLLILQKRGLKFNDILIELKNRNK